jgi:hypothetical protein
MRDVSVKGHNLGKQQRKKEGTRDCDDVRNKIELHFIMCENVTMNIHILYNEMSKQILLSKTYVC